MYITIKTKENIINMSAKRLKELENKVGGKFSSGTYQAGISKIKFLITKKV